MKKEMEKRSKYLSYILRHKPEEVNSKLDEFGWLSVEDLVNNSDFTIEELSAIVEADTRYEFSQDMTKIRAFHGHSVKGVKYQNEVNKPILLFHGTTFEAYEKILKSQAILPMSRDQVHLSASKNDARRIARRHGDNIVIIMIDTQALFDSGLRVYKSEDNVYLVDKVPLSCIGEIIQG